jgi:hypothetical protein
MDKGTKKKPYWIRAYLDSLAEVRGWGWVGTKGDVMRNLLALIVIGIAAYRLRSIGFALNALWSGFWPEILALIILFFFSPLIALLNLFWSIPKREKAYQAELAGLKNPDPNVVALPVEREDFQVIEEHYYWNEPSGNPSGTVVQSTSSLIQDSSHQVKYKTMGPWYERYYVPLKNVQLSTIPIRDAEDVHAVITVRNGNTFGHEKPRWLDQPTPDLYQAPIVIKANEKPEGLFLVIRERGGNALYIFKWRQLYFLWL